MLHKNAFGKTELNFMQGFTIAILPKMKNCQYGTFEPLHEIQKLFFAESILLKHYHTDRF
jgi:hypothetical protein